MDRLVKIYFSKIRNFIKNTKGQTISNASYDFLNSPKKRKKHTILSKEHAQDSEFRSFFERIEETIIYFRDLLTFRDILL